ncbi:MAG: flippase-like domain-containing protein [Nocardioidaceae bacterium]|nr:flippase-like domain-containing protein [Nocardioidaceae bacterium]
MSALNPRLRAWLVRGGLLVVAVVATVAIVRMIGAVDWTTVGHALRHLDWWQFPLLALLLVVRQSFNSMPLAFYVAGVTPYRAVINDQVAFLIGTAVPPPADVAMRVAMFSSWGVPVAAGLAGAMLHKLTFWIVRFGAPVVGIAILVARGDHLGLSLFDLASIGVALAILVGLLLIMRSDGLASGIGRSGGRVVRRFRSVDPEGWAVACVRFRADVSARFRSGFPRSIVMLLCMLVIDSTMVTLCMRFVGVPSSAVATASIVAGFAIAYPLSVFPFNGIGLIDAAVIGAVTLAGGHAVEAPAVAAMLVWRVFDLGGPMAFGAVSVLLWRRTTGSRMSLRQMLRSKAPAH